MLRLLTTDMVQPRLRRSKTTPLHRREHAHATLSVRLLPPLALAPAVDGTISTMRRPLTLLAFLPVACGGETEAGKAPTSLEAGAADGTNLGACQSTSTTCDWRSHASDAACPSGSCPIVLDAVLRCDDPTTGGAGFHVAPAGTATWVATSSANDSIVYRIDNGAFQRQAGIPDGFAGQSIDLVGSPEATAQLAAFATTCSTAEPPGMATTWAAPYGGAWKESLASALPLVSFEVGSDGLPRIWVQSSGTSAYAILTSNTDATYWEQADAPPAVPDEPNFFTLDSNNMSVALSFDSNYQLQGLERRT